MPVFEKKLVVVACEPVAFTKVKFWRVEEPETSKSPVALIEVVALPPILSDPPFSKAAKKLVEVA